MMTPAKNGRDGDKAVERGLNIDPSQASIGFIKPLASSEEKKDHKQIPKRQLSGTAMIIGEGSENGTPQIEPIDFVTKPLAGDNGSGLLSSNLDENPMGGNNY